MVFHDVTELRRLEAVRKDFIAKVSHELRTPVSVIQANTETLPRVSWKVVPAHWNSLRSCGEMPNDFRAYLPICWILHRSNRALHHRVQRDTNRRCCSQNSGEYASESRGKASYSRIRLEV